MDRWKRLETKTIHETAVLTLEEVALLRPGRDEPVRFVQLRCPQWVNVIPFTEDGQVILIRQYRAGTHEVTLEIPGGMVDPGEDPLATAGRELTEETGWVAGTLEEIGSVDPNPAIQDNRCTSYLARGCCPVGRTDFDPDEEIETLVVDLAEIPRRIAAGEIRHALVIAAFYHLFVTRGVTAGAGA
jgi:ADP-ribose pyrophosphatase